MPQCAETREVTGPARHRGGPPPSRAQSKNCEPYGLLPWHGSGFDSGIRHGSPPCQKAEGGEPCTSSACSSTGECRNIDFRAPLLKEAPCAVRGGENQADLADLADFCPPN